MRRRPLVVVGVVLLVLVVVAVISVVAAAVLAKRVTGDSMAPTLHDGDRVVVTPSTGGSADRFDVVVAKDPSRAGTEIVKRVIGLPGDAVAIRGDQPGRYEVLVRPANTGPWQRVVSPARDRRWQMRTPCCTPQGTKSAQPTPRVVPAGSYFVLGDNPDVSLDSRTFGWVKGSSIDGRIGLRVWPLSDLGGIGGRPSLVPIG